MRGHIHGVRQSQLRAYPQLEAGTRAVFGALLGDPSPACGLPIWLGWSIDRIPILAPCLPHMMIPRWSLWAQVPTLPCMTRWTLMRTRTSAQRVCMCVWGVCVHAVCRWTCHCQNKHVQLQPEPARPSWSEIMAGSRAFLWEHSQARSLDLSLSWTGCACKVACRPGARVLAILLPSSIQAHLRGNSTTSCLLCALARRAACPLLLRIATKLFHETKALHTASTIKTKVASCSNWNCKAEAHTCSH